MKLNFKYNRKAFTLVELLIVIAIIGILFVVLVSKVDFATDKAKTTGVQTDFRSFQVAFETVSRENAGFNSLGWDTGDKADDTLIAGYTYENADKDGGDRVRNSYDKGDMNLNGICEDGETWTGQKIYTEIWTGIYTLDNPADDTDMSAYIALEKAINKNLDPALQISIDPENKTIYMANGYQDPWKTEYHGFYLTNAKTDGKDRGAIVMYSDGPNKVFGSEQTIANGIVSVTVKNGGINGQDDLSLVTCYTYMNGYGEVATMTEGFSNNQVLSGNSGGEIPNNPINPDTPEIPNDPTIFTFTVDGKTITFTENESWYAVSPAESICWGQAIDEERLPGFSSIDGYIIADNGNYVYGSKGNLVVLWDDINHLGVYTTAPAPTTITFEIDQDFDLFTVKYGTTWGQWASTSSYVIDNCGYIITDDHVMIITRDGYSDFVHKDDIIEAGEYYFAEYIINYTVNGIPHFFNRGALWEERWEYIEIDGEAFGLDFIVECDENGVKDKTTGAYLLNPNGTRVQPYDMIINGYAYTLEATISFDIDGNEYTVPTGMTWSEWCETTYDEAYGCNVWNDSGNMITYAPGYGAICYQNGSVVNPDTIIKSDSYVHLW